MYKTPFEKNILPGYAKWFYNICILKEPNFFVPIERKGAHILDATLKYLQFEHGFSIKTPILYKRAFFFNDQLIKNKSKILLVDDSTNSGRTLNNYKELFKRHGNLETQMIACIGLEDSNNHKTDLREDIESYKTVPIELYHEYLWEIAEFVISKGLPPELDHHVFTIKAEESFSLLWASTLELLKEQGQLDIHGKLSDKGPIYGATLHWPNFFGENILDYEGPIRRDGVIKIRLYADYNKRQIVIIPMIYPEIELLNNSKSTSNKEYYRSVFKDWENRPHKYFYELGRIILDNSSPQYIVPEILYNAVCIVCEFEMVKEFINLLGKKCVVPFTFECSTDNFNRLYGPNLGSKLIRTIEEEINNYLPKFEKPSCTMNTFEQETKRFFYDDSIIKDIEIYRGINQSVSKFTNRLVNSLNSSCIKKNKGKPKKEWELVGYSFGQFLEGKIFSEQEESRLLLSRCIDYACKSIVFVPYVSVENKTLQHSISVARKYRTSELEIMTASFSEEEITLDTTLPHFDDYKKEFSLEIVALVIDFIAKRSARWSGKPVPEIVLNKVLAILLEAIPEIGYISSLELKAEKKGPMILSKEPSYIGAPSFSYLKQLSTDCFRITNKGGYEITKSFEMRYKNRSLIIDHRNETQNIESYLSALIPLMDDVSNIDNFITCWAMTLKGNLGLDYTMENIHSALKELLIPINILSSGKSLSEKKIKAACNKAVHNCGIGRSKIKMLKKNWCEVFQDKWQNPIAVEMNFLDTIFKQSPEQDFFYRAADSFICLVRRFANVFSEIDLIEQKKLFKEDENSTEKILALIQTLSEMEIILRTMRPTSVSLKHITKKSPYFEIEIGNRIKRFVNILKQFTAAYAWFFPDGNIDIFHIPFLLEKYKKPITRSKAVLVTDLKGSTKTSLRNEHTEYTQKVNRLLNLIARWGFAFGADENIVYFKREGDSIYLIEFTYTDSAVICGAMIQEHLKALRSTGSKKYSNFHSRIAIDSYLITTETGANEMSSAINRASKLLSAYENETLDNVFVTPEVNRDCSDKLRGYLQEKPECVVDLGIGSDRGHFVTFSLDREKLIDEYISRLLKV